MFLDYDIPNLKPIDFSSYTHDEREQRTLSPLYKSRANPVPAVNH
jgi:hypothetical protein